MVRDAKSSRLLHHRVSILPDTLIDKIVECHRFLVRLNGADLLHQAGGSLEFVARKSVILDRPKFDTEEVLQGLFIYVLAVAGVGAAFVSDWFVEALQPAMQTLGINETFAGLVIVAIAGNAIENFVGIQLAYRNQSDYSVSVILNSSLQIALGLFPLLVLLSYVLGGAILSFVLTPMLLACLALAVIVSAFIVFDGESIWLEGLALVGLYCLIAAAFWWG